MRQNKDKAFELSLGKLSSHFYYESYFALFCLLRNTTNILFPFITDSIIPHIVTVCRMMLAPPAIVNNHGKHLKLIRRTLGRGDSASDLGGSDGPVSAINWVAYRVSRHD